MKAISDLNYLLTLAAAALITTGIVVVGAFGFETPGRSLIPHTMFAAAVPVAIMAWLSMRLEHRLAPRTHGYALLIILGAAIVMRLILLPSTPFSTDIYRYIWDGRVQGAGINPYLFFPADPAVTQLRDSEIFPHINRVATAPTIYPPLAQVVFFTVTRLSEKVWAMKLAMVVFEAVAIAAIIALLKALGLPASRVLIFAWHPLAVYEFAGSGHVDAIAIAFMMLACLAADRSARRPGIAGLLLAAGTLAKFFPAVIAPALYRRWDWRALIAGSVAIALGYGLYISVGSKVLGYLPGYMHEENLTRGDGFLALGLISRVSELPSWASALYLAIAGCTLAAMAAAAIFRRDRERASMGWALALITAFTLFLSPHLAWYYVWVLPFLCFVPSAAVFYLTAAAPFLYPEAGLTDGLWRSGLIQAPFLVLLAWEFLIRRRTALRPHVTA